VLFGPISNLDDLGSCVLVAVKWSPLVRCLVVLLSLALANGNAHAVLHLSTAHSSPCPEEHAHHDGGPASPHHQHQPDKGFACCCDCLSCSPAGYLLPSLSTTPAAFTSQTRYDVVTTSLSGRVLLPEPHPPRPCTLS
jgi:hypothetical protein